VRLAESGMTAAAYLYVGLYSATSLALVPWILPAIVIGVPIGARIIQRVEPETFRRVCMSFDAWIVGFGLSTVVREVRLIESYAAYGILAAVALVDVWLLYRFFHRRPARTAASDAFEAVEETFAPAAARPQPSPGDREDPSS
jgi:hypothetical protein